MKTLLKKVMEKEDLTLTEMEEAARFIFSEETSDIAIGAFLAALKTKGETVDEITGLVNVLLEPTCIAG